MNISLCSIGIEMGEKELNYYEIDNFNSLIKEKNLTNSPEYWGWGKYRTTERSSFELLESAIHKSLKYNVVDPKEIEMVILCSSGIIGEYNEINLSTGSLLSKFNLDNALTLGQCFTGCVSIFSAIYLGIELIKSKRLKNILIATTDVIKDENIRFREFGIYSDSASCFLLTNNVQNDFQILNSSWGTSPMLMSGAMKDQDDHFQHLKMVHQKLIDGLDFQSNDFNKVFLTNLYKPLLQINIARLGYKKQQLYLDNINKFGHCFASDPLVNLISFIENNDEGDKFIIGAMATGHAGFCALKKIK